MENEIFKRTFFKVGDHVELIDAGGGEIGYIGDRGQVVFANDDYRKKDILITVQMTSGIHAGKKSNRYAYRWKLIGGDWDE